MPKTPDNSSAPSAFRHVNLIIIFGMIATTLAQTQVLARLPIQNLLKAELGVQREQMAAFFFWCGLAWYCKPLAGILTDSFPLFGTRRRWYLLLSAALAGVSWVTMGLLPHQYHTLLIGAITLESFMVIMSTVVGGYMVEAGQALNITGRLASLRTFVMYCCSLVSSPLSGYLATGTFLLAAGVNAAVVLSVIPFAWIYLRESSNAVTDKFLLNNVRNQLKVMGKSRAMWMAVVFSFLFYFSPGFSTILYYKQTDELKFSQQFIGNLGVLSSGFGLVAVVVYSRLVRRFELHKLLSASIFLAAIGTLFYRFYTNSHNAIWIESQNGFFFTLTTVALLDLAARAAPKGCEGMGYALLLSAQNIALLGADYLGSYFADHYHIQYLTMVYVNAGSTLLVLVLLPVMLRVAPDLMRGRDGG